jgi:hypothetical protein
MIGVGRVFNMYRSGALTDDDEVALTYAPPELGYASLSLPMVNIRATLSAAVESGTFKQELADTLIAAAKGLYFPDRTVQLLCEHALLGEADSQTVKALFSSFYVDVKREDTIRLLDSVRRNAFDGKLGQPQFSLNESKYFRAQMQQDRWTDIDGARVTQSEICKHVALHHGGFDAMRERALTKALLMIFAAHIGLKVSADELELERTIFLSERGLESAAAVTVWRESNDMTETEWEELLTELATVRRLSKWFIARQGRLRITKPLLDELKLSGNYPRWARSAAHKQQIIGELPPETGSRNDRAASVLELMKDQHLNGEWPLPVDIFEWMELSGFDNIDELRQELSLNAYFRSRKLGAEK